MNELRERNDVITVCNGEKFYTLYDLDDSIFSHYAISKSGNIVTNLRRKPGDYHILHQFPIKTRRSTVELSIELGDMVKRYISELVAYNFLVSPKGIDPDTYNVGNKTYYRTYDNYNGWYLIFKDRDLTNHSLSNLKYARYAEYVDYCIKDKSSRTRIKNIDKDLMVRIFDDNDVTQTFISNMFHLNRSGFHWVYRTYYPDEVSDGFYCVEK